MNANALDSHSALNLNQDFFWSNVDCRKIGKIRIWGNTGIIGPVSNRTDRDKTKWPGKSGPFSTQTKKLVMRAVSAFSALPELLQLILPAYA